MRYKTVQDCFKFVDDHYEQLKDSPSIEYHKQCCAYCFGRVEKPPVIPAWTPPETESPGILKTMEGYYTSLGTELGQTLRKPFVSFLKSTLALEDKTAESIATPLMIGGVILIIYLIFKLKAKSEEPKRKVSKPKRKLKLRSPITFEEERKRPIFAL